MYFYKLYFISFIIIIVYVDDSYGRSKWDVTSGVRPLSPWSTALVLEARLNNTEGVDYDVVVEPNKCCLVFDHGLDCEVLSAIGRGVGHIPTGTTKTLELVAPLLNPYERKGFCLAFLDSQPSDKQTEVYRDTIKINFDTSLNKKYIDDNFPDFVKKCAHIDEDPLNNCLPVDCETYYNDKKSHYSRNLKRCVSIPSCYYNLDLELPNVLYDPTSNLCVGGEIVTDDDIKFIKSVVHGKVRAPKDILIIKNENLDSNDSDVGGRKFKNDGFYENDLSNDRLGYTLFTNCLSNRGTLTLFGVVIIVQCCLICTMVYCLVKTCTCCSKKKVIRKFFNRQDVSVTTPLICTSNIDTETTDCQYLSESSNNINNKIKCYKSCQKSTKDAVQVSMSDDILSKCLNRRVWQRQSSKSVPAPDSPLGSNEYLPDDKKEISRDTKLLSVENPEPKYDRKDTIKEKHKNCTDKKDRSEIKNDTSLVYENEKNKKNEKKSEKKHKKDDKHKRDKNEKRIKKPVTADKSLITKDEKKTSFDMNLAQADSDDIRALSEKEIRCHTYIDSAKITGFKPTARHKHAAFVKTDTVDNKISVNDINRESTEKEAQAFFSNDSVEDYLSERGIIYIPGENTSKYEFSSHTDPPRSSSISEVTSKTSKNSASKNFLDIFKAKKKVSISDPGASKANMLDLQVLHLSKESMSSSSLEEQCLKNLLYSKSNMS